MADKRALIQAGGGIKEIASGDSLDIPSGASYKIGANVAVLADAWGCMIGRGNTQSSSGAAIGNNCTATEILANAIGVESSATGMLSTAIGYSNTASEAGATAIGYSNTASEAGATAIGYSNTASGTGSIAIGNGCKATANNAVAMGSLVENGTANTAQFGPSNTAKMTITSDSDAAFGTATERVAAFDGRSLTVRGGSGGPGNLELASQQPDATNTTVAAVLFSDNNATGEKRATAIEGVVQGATANNRGGKLVFSTKADNGALTERLTIDNTGAVTCAGKITASGGIAVESVIAPTLLNSWVNFGSPNATAGYWKDAFGYVHTRGTIKSGTTTEGTVLFTLPSGYRPAATQRFAIADNKTIGTVQVESSGDVKIISGSNARFHLDGIMFRTD